VFERFTEDGRQVVASAQEQARSLNHDYIGTEHLLLALLAHDGIAPSTLAAFGVTIEKARAEVIRRVRQTGVEARGQMPFTPRAKKVLELALREAIALGHDFIASEHLLLGLAGDIEGVAAQILTDLGADPQAIREAVLEKMRLPEYRPRTRVTTASASGRTASIPRRAGPLPILDPSWLGAIATAMNRLAPEIRRELGRQPDPGDLLLVLALLEDTVADAALRQLGVNPDTLWATIERLRRQRSKRDEELSTRINEVRAAKELAIESQEHERAARLRDEERTLTEQRRSGGALSAETLSAIRRTLGLPGPSD
jgi:Clp amino terminal domain, pathogenicity island component/UvrB/uvrC motif